LLLICLLAACLFGQEFQGTILGRITDSSGAVVPAVQVKVVNTETGASSSTQTNTEGNYRIPFLLPGDYRLLIEHPGFQKIENHNVRVSMGTETTLDFVLQVSTAAETLTVTAAPTALNTSNADLGQVVEHAYIDNTPVSLTRNVLNNLALDAAVVGAGGNTYTSNGQSAFSIAGGGGTQTNNEVIVDGVPNTIARSGGLILYVPTQDSTEEMKVMTTMFDAAYGHTNGGVVSITTRGGGNQLHGAVYDYKKWAALNANSWSNNRLGLPKPPVSYDQFGFMVSGPVFLPKVYHGRNRTFFLVACEGDQALNDNNETARVPTALERTGDFSQTLNSLGTGLLQVYDPWTTVGTGNSATRTPFPGAKIPASRMDPTGATVMKTYGMPNLAVTPQIGKYNWYVDGLTSVDQRNYTGRIDQVVSDKQRVFLRYSRLVRIQDKGNIANLMNGVSSYPVNGNNNLGQDDRYMHNLVVDDTVTLSPTWVASFRYGFAMRKQYKSNPRTLLDPAPLNLPPIIAQNQFFRAFPTFDLSSDNLPTLGSTKSVNNFYTSTGMGTAYKQIGRHSLKFGVDFRLPRYNNLDPGSAGPGTFTFNSVFTQGNPFVNTSANTSGSAMAALLLGVPSSGSLGYNSQLSIQDTYTGLFVQEAWKVTPRLTLNFGLRYELETPYTERFNRDSYGFDPNAATPLPVPGLNLHGGLLFAGVNGNPRGQGNLDTNNFAPRFGFAWSLNSKTVVRGGYGLFYSSQAENDGGNLGAVATFNAVTSYKSSADSNATPFTTLANPFPAGLVTPQGSALGLAARYGDSLTYANQNRVNPYNQQWQVGLQREVPGRVLLEAAYMGMLSLKELQTFNMNEKPDKYLAQGQAVNNKITNPFLGIFNPQSSLGQGATISQGQLWGAFPQYSSLSVQDVNSGQAIYHSGQFKMTKRYSHGLNVLLSYNFSKLISSNTTSIINSRPYRGIASFDYPHMLRIAFVYQLPFGPGKALGSSLRGPLARIVEGWTLSGYINYRSGQPLSVSGPNGQPIMLRNPSKSGPASARLGDKVDPVTHQVLNPYFDTSAFQALADQFTIAMQPPYATDFRGPAAWGRNAALSKNVQVWERFKLQIRCEDSDFTNSVSWGNPGTNMSNQATFGVISSGGGGRSIQMSLRVMF
jgi:hypothetical protein